MITGTRILPEPIRRFSLISRILYLIGGVALLVLGAIAIWVWTIASKMKDSSDGPGIMVTPEDFIADPSPLERILSLGLQNMGYVGLGLTILAVYILSLFIFTMVLLVVHQISFGRMTSLMGVNRISSERGLDIVWDYIHRRVVIREDLSFQYRTVPLDSLFWNLVTY